VEEAAVMTSAPPFLNNGFIPAGGAQTVRHDQGNGRPSIALEIALALREFHVEATPLFNQARLDPGESKELQPAALGRLLSLSVTRCRCPHFGLLAGQKATIQSFGLVGRLMTVSNTLGEALQEFVSGFPYQNRGAVPTLVISDDLALLSFVVCQPNVESVVQILDAALASTVAVIRLVCGAEWHPFEVMLPRTVPADTEPFRRHFQAPIQYNEEIATLVFPAQDLDLPLPGSDPLLRGLVEEKIRSQKGSFHDDFPDDIRRLLRTQLAGQLSSADEIAHVLGVNRRTLSRRLMGRPGGGGYRSLANETRYALAQQLLRDTQIPISQVVAALGYSEASAFTRAFRRWSGVTPTAWRQRLRTGSLS